MRRTGKDVGKEEVSTGSVGFVPFCLLGVFCFYSLFSLPLYLLNNTIPILTVLLFDSPCSLFEKPPFHFD